MVDAPVVIAVSRDSEHRFGKTNCDEVSLVAGFGVQGDAHAGATVQHRSRVAANPNEPNLRQVHLIHAELLEELRSKGFQVDAGQLGENVLTRNLDILGLPQGTRLHVGPDAVLEVTGLRNPCRQINGLRPGLLQAVLGRTDSGALERRAGIMSVVLQGGRVRPGEVIDVRLPVGPHRALERV